MPALEQDTRLVMTILFVGTVSGANVFFYAEYGVNFPYSHFEHALLFGLITVGGIMCLKAVFDLSLNDRIEMWLLDRRIKAYWERKQRDEGVRAKLKDTMKQYSTTFNIPQAQLVPSYETEGVGNEFLAAIQE
tara:strand:- start:6151 stop:6549 length:399 start_codon:yes stop_codon:yes gene_type:complete